MELLKHFAPEFAQNQMHEKSLIFENEKYQKVPNKYKMLVGIGVAASLGSDTRTQTCLPAGRCGLRWQSKAQGYKRRDC